MCNEKKSELIDCSRKENFMSKTLSKQQEQQNIMIKEVLNMKIVLLLFIALTIAGLANAAIDITIGTDTNVQAFPIHDYASSGYSRTQSIYKETEIGAPGIIHKLRWYSTVSTANINCLDNIQIWLKTIPNETYNINSKIWEEPGTLVYSASTLSISAGAGWKEFDITDFTYPGGNLQVSVFTHNPLPVSAPNVSWRCSSADYILEKRIATDATNGLNDGRFRANLQINMTTSSIITAPDAAIIVTPWEGSYTMNGDYLKWSATGFPDNYDVYFDATDASTLVSSHQTGNTYTPLSMSAGTTYYWKIVPWNAEGGYTSDTVPVWSFKIPPEGYLAESFEGAAFPPMGWTATGTWHIETNSTRLGSQKALRETGPTTVSLLSTPLLTITATSSLSFWGYSNSSPNLLQLVYSANGTDWIQIGTDITFAQALKWFYFSYNLSFLAGNNYYLGFRTNSGMISVDLITGPEITPELPGQAVQNLPVNAAIDVSVFPALTWSTPISGGAPAGYRVYCDTNPNPTTLVQDSDAYSFTPVLPLNLGTTYFWKVIAYNSSGDGPESPARSFSTLNTTTSFPFIEGFETGNTNEAAVDKWMQIRVSDNYDWLANTVTGNTAPRTGTYNVTKKWTGIGWLMKPFTFIGGTTYNLELYARRYSTGASASSSLDVYFGNSAMISSFTNVVIPSTVLSNTAYQRLAGSFSPTTSGVYWLGIRVDAINSNNYTMIDDIRIDEVFDYPNTSPVVNGANIITITGGNANNGTGEIPPVQSDEYVPQSSYIFHLYGAGPWSVSITTSSPWGAYYYGGHWNSVPNVGGVISFNIDPSKDEEVPVVLGETDPTLPVELSSFTATIEAYHSITLQWVTQSETNVNGYYIYRGTSSTLNDAALASPLIQATNTSQQQVYQFSDNEVFEPGTYYYWLEVQDLNGSIQFHGPVSVYFDNGSNHGTPNIPRITGLKSIYPNPFNPNTTIAYELTQASDVKIEIYNSRGQLTNSINRSHNEAGHYSWAFEARDFNGRMLSSGIYQVVMTAGKTRSTQKMVLLK